MSEIMLTSENFNREVLQSDKPVLVDFWATWCGPCRMLAPILGELAEKYAGRITVGKVNVDEQEALAEQYQISSIPTLILFRGGKPVQTSLGYLPMEELEALLNASI